MKNISLPEATDKIDDAYIERAIEIDSAEKLRQAMFTERMKKTRLMTRRLATAAACLCIVTAGMLMLRRTSVDNPAEVSEPGNVMMGNPITDVESYDELERYMGYKVPRLEFKTTETLSVISYEGEPKKAKMVFTDGSQLLMMKGTGDISGIFGATLETTVTVGVVPVYIGVVPVYMYRFDSVHYAVWSYKGYSYCYIVNNAGSGALYGDVERIIRTIE